MTDTYSLQDAITDLETIWDKLSKQQVSYISKLISKIKAKDNPPIKNQMTVDEFLKELAEDYRRKNASNI